MVDSYLREEEEAAERLAARVRLGVIGALAALQLALLLTGIVDVRDAEIGLAAAALAAIYGTALALWLRWRGYRPAVSYLSIALDAAAVTGVTVASGLVPGVAAEATKSPYNLLFFLVIATAGLRQAPALPVFAGLSGAAGYLGVFAVAAAAQPQHVNACLACDFSGPDVSPVRVATVAALMVLAGFLTSVTARRARGLIGRAVSERSAAMREQQRREQLLGAMERYFPEKEALRLLAEGEDLKAGGWRRLVTVLMSDIRGFTTFSERLQPDQVVALLNRYFEEMVDIVFTHEGTLITFVGDAILAVYGLPEPRPDDAERAFQTALHMRRRLAELNGGGAFASVGGLRIGIALHTGDVLAGSIGSPRRLEYTVIGDTVNTAARLEEANKGLGSDLVVSATTVAALDARDGFVDRGPLQVRGREQKLRIYTVEPDPARVESR